MESIQSHRKNEHLSLAEKLYQSSHHLNQFDQVRIIPNSLPEIALDEVTLQTEINEDIILDTPFYIEAITGGSDQATKYNEQLAQLANKHGLAMASGSASIMLADPNTSDSFTVVRENDSDGIVFANVSANVSVAQAQAVVDLMHADALEVHVNVAQEIVMPEGEREFYWIDNLKRLNKEITVPVIVKEVGFGMSRETIQTLQNNDIFTVNISGRGGTNFVAIEDRRNHENDFSYLSNWGLSTVESLLDTKQYSNVNFIASGGVTSPLDVIKCGVLGAKAVGVAGYFLHILTTDGYDALDKEIAAWIDETKKLLALCGVRHFKELPKMQYILSNELINFLTQRR